MERYFWHLNAVQADGLACVLCGTNFLEERITAVPVGRSPADESQVFSCKACARSIADDAERLAQQMRKAAGAPTDGADVPDGADEFDDPVFCVDGHFGSLLRDLRTLAGAEALLATADEIPAVRFLLSLTARHAETAMMRARLVLARTTTTENDTGDGKGSTEGES